MAEYPKRLIEVVLPIRLHVTREPRVVAAINRHGTYRGLQGPVGPGAPRRHACAATPWTVVLTVTERLTVFGGVFPTRAWPVGQPLDVAVALAVPPDLAPGEYRLAVGWYDLRTGRRLAEAGGGAGGAADEIGIGVEVR